MTVEWNERARRACLVPFQSVGWCLSHGSFARRPFDWVSWEGRSCLRVI
jgi:hypothetical protein